MKNTPLNLIVKLERNLKKNSLWVYILKLLAEKPMHAYIINQAIQEKFGFSVAKETPYVYLYELEKCGLVESEIKKGRKRPVKVYKLTEEGERVLQESLKMFKEVVHMLS